MDVTSLELEGRVWMRRALHQRHIDALASVFSDPGESRRLRHAQLDPEVADVLGGAAREVLPAAQPVRVVSFDKSEEVNWALGWHQDRVVALSERHEVAGFSGWSNKNGVWHAEPPVSLLERMIFARIHLDAANENNGCLQLALGSHRLGKVPAVEAEVRAESCPVEFCIAEPGDVVFVKALTLHRSKASRSVERRRTLRVDYSAQALPAPLRWAEDT